MDSISAHTDLNIWIILVIVFFAFFAGFVDAVSGGGGLIQLPALLINLPNTPVPTLFGTNKIAALSGTLFSAYRYAQRIKFKVYLLAVMIAFAFVGSFIGAKLVSFLAVDILKPLVLFILIIIAIYTFIKKDLGNIASKDLSINMQLVYGSALSLILGFYDGFFGPGTGSLFVLGFVVLLGFDFLHASAYAKVINCVTNFSALIVFIKQGNYILSLAIAMAIANVLGSWVGTNMALKNGNKFIRLITLFIISIMILRYSYDIFFK